MARTKKVIRKLTCCIELEKQVPTMEEQENDQINCGVKNIERFRPGTIVLNLIRRFE